MDSFNRMHFLDRCRQVCPWLVLLAHGAVFAGERPWTVKDSVELTYFSAAQNEIGINSIIKADVTASSDGGRFFVITQKGDLSDDSNVYVISVYETNAVSATLNMRASTPPTPRWQRTIRSKSIRERGLYDVRWLHDSSAITYLAAEGDAVRQVMRWDLYTDTVTALTSTPLSVESYSMQGDVLVFIAWVDEGKTDADSLYSYPLTYMRQPDWYAALGGRTPLYGAFVRLADGTVRQIGPAQTAAGVRLEQPAVSPNGRTAIVQRSVPPTEAPAAWREYRSTNRDPLGVWRYFAIVDIDTGREKTAIDAPTGAVVGNWTSAQALWFPDSRRVLLVNSMLPMQADRPERLGTSYVLELDVTTGAYRVVDRLPAAPEGEVYPPRADVRWLKPGREFIVTYGASWMKDPIEHATVYSLSQKQWVARRAPAPASAASAGRLGKNLSVQIRQSLNEPPRLIASNDRGQIELMPPDPILDEVRRSPAQRISWSDRNGHEWHGLMVLPSSPLPRQGHPLIIQICDNDPEFFLPDGGSYRPGFAAQAMAARGFAVLTLDPLGGERGVMGTAEEGSNMVAGVDGAVMHLKGRALVDPQRVGVMGFSRMGYMTYYVATHAKEFVPAAAIVQDSFDASYIQYATVGVIFPREIAQFEEFEQQYAGGGSFWSNKQSWLAEAPGFNLDRMETPLLITQHYAPAVLSSLLMLEPYGGLSIRRRPVEAVLYKEAPHVLVRPRQRQAAMELAMDWMAFWINGEESADSAHATRNEHWRKLRNDWREAKNLTSSLESTGERASDALTVQN